MIKLVLQYNMGNVYIAVAQIVAMQPMDKGCFITTTRGAYQVEQSVDQIQSLLLELLPH